MIDRITPEMIEDVKTQLSEVFEITGEEHTERRMTFHTMPKFTASSMDVKRVENRIMDKYCNAPFTMASENHWLYRYTLICN